MAPPVVVTQNAQSSLNVKTVGEYLAAIQGGAIGVKDPANYGWGSILTRQSAGRFTIDADPDLVAEGKLLRVIPRTYDGCDTINVVQSPTGTFTIVTMTISTATPPVAAEADPEALGFDLVQQLNDPA